MNPRFPRPDSAAKGTPPAASNPGHVTLLGRRDLIKGTAALAAALATARLPLERAEAQIVPSPDGARTFETGLASFIARWEVAAPIIDRFEETRALARHIVNKTYNCETTDRPGTMHFTLTTLNGVLAPGPNPLAFMTIRMPEPDWVALTYGPYHLVATALAERVWISKDEMNAAFVLGAVMNLLAQLDSGRLGREIAAGNIPSSDLDARCPADR